MGTSESAVRMLRIYAIDEEVRNGTYPTARTLSEKLKVSTRTIMRDIDFCAAGFVLRWRRTQ